jgi:hypothetical protein
MAHIATALFPQPTFFKECLRLLYWTYFKPYTLRRYLRTIHQTWRMTAILLCEHSGKKSRACVFMLNRSGG